MINFFPDLIGSNMRYELERRSEWIPIHFLLFLSWYRLFSFMKDLSQYAFILKTHYFKKSNIYIHRNEPMKISQKCLRWSWIAFPFPVYKAGSLLLVSPSIVSKRNRYPHFNTILHVFKAHNKDAIVSRMY